MIFRKHYFLILLFAPTLILPLLIDEAFTSSHQELQSMSVSTDKTIYNSGDIVTIKGSGAQSYSISIQILSPDGEEITEISTFKTGAGDFSTLWVLPNGLGHGTYTIRSSDASQTVETLITIGAKSMTQITESSKSKTNIPNWIKQVAEFWISDQIDDVGFVQVIEYLVQQEIIAITYAEAPEGDAATQIPSWIKTNTEFWVNGDISNDEFAIGLEWLINNGIIRVQDAVERAVASYKIEGNYYPIHQFKMTPTSPDCPDYHLHATSGYTIDAVLVSFTDHNPGACGLGMVNELILEHPTMTENQILAWQKAVGIEIPEE